MSNIPPPPPGSPPPPPRSDPSSFASGPVTPCDNGIRLGALMLETLLILVTCFIGWLIWSIVLWQQSTTPAKKMLGLRVVDASTGAPATMQQMVMREVVGKLALGAGLNFVGGSLGGGDLPLNLGSALWVVSGIMILVNASRQGVWDLIAKTTVVRAN